MNDAKSSVQQLKKTFEEKPGIDFSKTPCSFGQLFTKRRPKKDKWNTSRVVHSVPCEDTIHLKKIIAGTHIFKKGESCVNQKSGYRIDNSWTLLLKNLRLT